MFGIERHDRPNLERDIYQPVFAMLKSAGWEIDYDELKEIGGYFGNRFACMEETTREVTFHEWVHQSRESIGGS